MEQEVKESDPMMFGCMIFTAPFVLLVAWITFAVIFNWR